MRALLGWSPTWDVQPLEGGGWRAIAEPEWDSTELNLALAVDEIDAQICKGCGGDLSVELTDKHPMEDDGDGHYHKGKFVWCRGCVAQIRLQRQVEQQDRDLEGTAADSFPGARFTTLQRLPIPTSD